MDGIHDMGGMHGFGPIPVEDDGPKFPEPWMGRVLANTLALSPHLGGNVDQFRHRIENIAPAAYLASSYYERWFTSMVIGVHQHQLLTDDELAQVLLGQSPDLDSLDVDALPPESVAALTDSPTGYQRDMDGNPAYAVNDQVRARTEHRPGHTRLPRYVRGRLGRIVSDNGNAHLPDEHADTGTKLLQRLYTVEFAARELWGETANPRDTVRLDLWESYLEPA